MAAPTDLSWQHLNGALLDAHGSPLNFVFIGEPDAEGFSEVKIDLSSLTGYPITNGQSKGVIKALSRLLEAARNAQEKLNEGKPAGERLAAFPPPTTGATANGTVPITRSIASRAVLSSVTQIDGATA